MNNNLRDYIDTLFREAPPTKKTVEVKEEILQNLIDKYNDLLADGKSEEAAYNIAVASVGDISELIEELKGGYVMQTNPQNDAQYEAARVRDAALTAIAVMLYILCVIPVILFQSEFGVIVMFLMIASATGLLVFKNMVRRGRFPAEDTLAEEFREWREHSSERNQVFKAVSSALWAVTVGIYILVSFWTRAWHVTWVIFLLAGAANSILKAVFDLRR